MNAPTGLTTTTLLLESLKDPAKDAVWREFDLRYRPLLVSFARSLGLSPEDSDEVAQESLTEFVRAYRQGKYSREKGRLSSWIIAIARNRIADRRRVLAKRAGQRGESAMIDLRNDAQLTQLWETERRRSIYFRALDMLREGGKTEERTMQAFELVTLRGVPAQSAAAECGMSVDEVYVAKNRVTKRLRAIVEQLTAAYTEDG